MITNAVDLQEYVNQINDGNPQWYESGGMLGLGLFGSLVATFILFWIIAYIIGVMGQYKETKTWLLPNGRYWMNIFRAVSICGKSLFGIATPRQKMVRNDSYYYKPTRDEFDAALIVVHQLMIDGGWTIADYQKRSKDCEDYAMKMSVELRNYIATTWNEKVRDKGVAIGIIAYTRDVDGVGHVIVQAFLDSGVEYFEPYPGEKYLKQKPMTQRELDSINMSIL